MTNKTKLSKAIIATFFGETAVALDLKAQEVAASVTPEASDVEKHKALMSAKSLITREKRLAGLAKLSDGALGILYQQMRSTAVTPESLADAASYGLDKVIRLLEATASDTKLVMKSDKDGNGNLALAFEFMAAKKRERVTQAELKRETGHATDTQAGYITRTLAALGVVKRWKQDGVFQIELVDSPLTSKLKQLYGIGEPQEAVTAE